VFIEQIIDLDRELKPLRQVVVREEICDGVARRNPRPGVVHTIGLIGIVLVAARVRTGYGYFAQIENKPLCGLKTRISLARLFRNEGNSIARVDIDVSIKPRITRKRGVAGIACRTVDDSVALVRSFQESVVEALGNAADASIEIRVNPLSAGFGEVLKVSGT